MLVYGPVSSRRLGRRLGLNNIPYKYCSYSCPYCLVGPTTKKQITPAVFYQPQALLEETKAHIEKVGVDQREIDYISFSPDGEPTLDSNLATLIRMLKRELSIPVAVISNGSLLWREEVREALIQADLVSLKVDSVSEPVWRNINRPDERLQMSKVLNGIRDFAAGFRGELITETMLVDEVNTAERDLQDLAAYLRGLSPQKAYLAVPAQPPTDELVPAPAKDKLSRAHQLFVEAGLSVKCLTRKPAR